MLASNVDSLSSYLETNKKRASDKKPISHPWKRHIKSIHLNKIKTAHNSIKNPVYPPPSNQVKKLNLEKFKVYGVMTAKEFIYCARLLVGISKYKPMVFEDPIIRGFTTTEWIKEWNNLKLAYGQKAYCINSPVVVIYNDTYLGGDKELKKMMEKRYVYNVQLNYRKEAEKMFYQYIKSTNRPFVYMHIMIDDQQVGTLIFALYSDIVPRTCENFLRLSTSKRGGYTGTPIHRIVKDCWIQCGGYGLKETDLGCENYQVPFDKRGIVGMCNSDRHVDCSTQFFIILQPMDWMNGKYVGFGQLVDGEETLKKIESLPTYYESPQSTIMIMKSGLLNPQCKRNPINKNTLEYLNKHIDDLVRAESFFAEMIMVYFWATLKAKEEGSPSKLTLSTSTFNSSLSRRSKGTGDGDDFAVPKLSTPDMSVQLKNSKKNLSTILEVEKENNEFDQESYVPEEYEKLPVPITKPEKPFYIPFTDIPYPGEVSSEYELKRLIKGDYCLEGDLQVDLPKNPRDQKKKLMRFKEITPMFFQSAETFDLMNENADMSATEIEEAEEYMRFNSGKVSYSIAGGTIPEIARGKAKRTRREEAGAKRGIKCTLCKQECKTGDPREEAKVKTRNQCTLCKQECKIADPREEAEAERRFKCTLCKKECKTAAHSTREEAEAETGTKCTLCEQECKTAAHRQKAEAKRSTTCKLCMEKCKTAKQSTREEAEAKTSSTCTLCKQECKSSDHRAITLLVPPEIPSSGKKMSKRRATGLPTPEIKKILAEMSEDEEDDIFEIKPASKDSQKSRVQISTTAILSQKLKSKSDFRRSMTGRHDSYEIGLKKSVLTRLIDKVNVYDDDEAPTLKTFRTQKEDFQKNILLKPSKNIFALDDSEDFRSNALAKRSLQIHQSRFGDSVDTASIYVVQDTMNRKDYTPKYKSIRGINYYKRPTMSVEEYRAMNSERLKQRQKEQNAKEK